MSENGGGNDSHAAEPVTGAAELLVEALSAGGDGVAHLEGKAVFLPGTAPGDRVRARIGRDRGRWARAEVLELIEAGEGRVEAPCPVASECGGCQWQQVSEAAQRQGREEILSQALSRIAGLDEWPKIEYVGGKTLGYRRRAIYHGTTAAGGERSFGFFARASHRIVEHGRCLLLEEPLAAAMAEFGERIRGKLRGESEFSVEATLLEGPVLQILIRCETKMAASMEAAVADWIPAGFDAVHLSLRGLAERRIFREAKGAPFLLENATAAVDGGEPLSYSLYTRPGEFVQTNADANRRLVQAVIRMADVKDEDWLLDLYCGAGNFCIPLALRGAKVMGVERKRAALRSARKAARQAGAARARFRAGASADILAELVKEGKRYRTVVLDPPRTGAPELAEYLDVLGIERIVSVSCHAASFARDLKAWRKRGFVLESVEIHDLFPQTYHGEVLALLTRKA